MATVEKKFSPQISAGIVKRMRQILVVLVIDAALLFLAAGRLDWIGAWVFLVLYLVAIAINSIFMFHYSPETIARRASAEGVKGWDRIVSGLWAAARIITLIVAGLDARNGWSQAFTPATYLVSIVVFEIGGGLFSWAMITNAYFATVVRVQTDSGHRVCTSGPYRFVRHPGYVGAIIQALALPIILGSMWALVPGFAAALLIVIRTALEDATLQKELIGYEDYARQVRYRLLPGLW